MSKEEKQNVLLMNDEIVCPEPGHWIGCNYPFEYKGFIIDEFKYDKKLISVTKDTKMKLFFNVDEAMAWIDGGKTDI